jgi:hypothetical protein
MRRMLVLFLVVGTMLAAAGAPAQGTAPGTVSWLSRVGLNGVGSNGSSAFFARPSADGSKVVFITDATNLGGGASGTQAKAYLRDVRTGTNTLVSNDAYDAVISGDGKWIAFATFDPVPGFVDANGSAYPDTYLYEVATGHVTLVSHTTASATTTGDGWSDTPSLSYDGRYVLFSSGTDDLVSGITDDNTDFDAFLYDRVTGTTTFVSRKPGSATTGLDGGVGGDLNISPDGRYAVLITQTDDAVPGFADGNGGGFDVYLTLIGSGRYQVLNHTPGAPLTGATGGVVSSTSSTGLGSMFVSNDAGKVAWLSNSGNQVSGFSDQNGTGLDAYVWDRGSDTVKLASHEFGSATRGGNGASSEHIGLSADGSLLAYSNRSTTIVPNVTGLTIQTTIFGYDTRTGDNSLLSHTAANPLAASSDTAVRPFPSADGRFVSFVGLANDLVAGFVDNNGGGNGDSFMIDRTGSPAPVSQTPPAITGSVTMGSTLTCSPGTWSEDPTFAFSWQRGTVQVGTGSTYALTADDVSQPLRCVVIATTFGGSTAAASGAVTLPPTIAGASGPAGPPGQNGQPGPAGPAGADAPVAFALAAAKFTVKANKNLKLAFVSTAAGRLTWTATAKGQRPAKKTVDVKAGRGTFTIKLPKKGSWKLAVTVTAGGKTARDSATVRVR